MIAAPAGTKTIELPCAFTELYVVSALPSTTLPAYTAPVAFTVPPVGTENDTFPVHVPKTDALNCIWTIIVLADSNLNRPATVSVVIVPPPQVTVGVYVLHAVWSTPPRATASVPAEMFEAFVVSVKALATSAPPAPLDVIAVPPPIAAEVGVMAPRVSEIAGVVVAVATVPDTPLAVVTETEVTVPDPPPPHVPPESPIEVRPVHLAQLPVTGLPVTVAPPPIWAVKTISSANAAIATPRRLNFPIDRP